LKGVSSVEYDTKTKLFNLVVDTAAGFRPSELQAAVPKKYTIEKVVVEALPGQAAKEGEKTVFTAKGSGLKYALQDPDGKVPAGKVVRVVGEAKEVEQGEGEKKTVVLTLVAASAEEIKDAK
jgi:hypothetical protein